MAQNVWKLQALLLLVIAASHELTELRYHFLLFVAFRDVVDDLAIDAIRKLYIVDKVYLACLSGLSMYVKCWLFSSLQDTIDIQFRLLAGRNLQVAKLFEFLFGSGEFVVDEVWAVFEDCFLVRFLMVLILDEDLREGVVDGARGVGCFFVFDERVAPRTLDGTAHKWAIFESSL